MKKRLKKKMAKKEAALRVAQNEHAAYRFCQPPQNQKKEDKFDGAIETIIVLVLVVGCIVTAFYYF